MKRGGLIFAEAAVHFVERSSCHSHQRWSFKEELCGSGKSDRVLEILEGLWTHFDNIEVCAVRVRSTRSQ